MKNILTGWLVLLFLFSVSTTQSEPTAKDKKQDSHTYVLIVGGINKDPEEKQAKDKAIIKLRKALVTVLKPGPENLRVLVTEDSFVSNATGVSTAENLQKTLSELAKIITPDDRFIFFFVGQANVVMGPLRLNLPGPDLNHEQLTAWLKDIPAAEQLIILDCPCAGLAVKSLTAKGRIIICAARSDQPYSTRFCEYFAPSLTDKTSDFDKDERISLLEAFQQTAYQLDKLYRQEELLMTEIPLLDDDGDGIPSQQPWRYQEDKNDGRAAAKFFLINKDKLEITNESK